MGDGRWEMERRREGERERAMAATAPCPNGRRLDDHGVSELVAQSPSPRRDEGVRQPGEGGLG